MKMIPKLEYEQADLEILVHLFIENPNKNVNIIFNKQWRKCHEEQLKALQERGTSTTLIEIEVNQWVTLHLRLDPEDEDIDSYIINYIGNDKEYFLNNFGFLENRTFFKNYNMDYEENCSWFYSLHSAKMLFSKSNSEIDLSFLQEQSEIEVFMETVRSTLNQISKIRKKIQVCHKLLTQSLSMDVPVISDAKYALIFFYFTEAVSLQDEAFQDHSKKYFKTLFGEESIEIVQKIRNILLHREENSIIFPSQFHKYFFDEVNCKVILNNLSLYVGKLKDIIEGKAYENSTEDPLKFLKCPEKLGNHVDDKDVKLILYKYASEFLREISSIKFKNPNEIMFNFVINYVPLLGFLYKNHISSFSVIQLRNQLVHNIYILQQEDSDLPTICLERMFTEIKDQFLSFYIGYEITGILKNISNHDGPSKVYKELKDCYESFKSKFKGQYEEEKDIITNSIYRSLTETGKVNFLIKLIEEYLNCLPLVDNENKVSIKNVNINKFQLHTEYDIFSHKQRRSIFIALKVIKIVKSHHQFSREDLFSLEEFIMLDLMKTGLSKKNLKSMIYSISHPKPYRNEELVKIIVQHIYSIEKMLRNSDPISEVMEDYSNVMDGKPIENKIRKNCFESLKIDNSFLEIDICGNIIYMDLLSIVNNIVTIVFNFQNQNNKLWKNLNAVLNNDTVLEYIVDENVNKQILKNLIPDIPELVPLCVKLLNKKHRCFKKEDEPDLISKCIPILVSRKIEPKYLKDIMHLTINKKNFDILNEILDYVNKNFSTIDKIILNFLFMDESFISKTMKSIKKAPEQPVDNIIEIGKDLLQFTYMNARNMYNEQEFEKTFEDICSKYGLNNILKELIGKKCIAQTKYFQYKFFISKVFNTVYLFKKDGEEIKRCHNIAFDILNGILSKAEEMNDNDSFKRPWVLKIKCYLAYTHHLLEDHEKALDLYIDLSSSLMSITDDTIKKPVKVFKDLINSDKYKSEIRLYPKHLNIIKILYCYFSEIEHIGSSKGIDDQMKYYERAIQGYINLYVIQRKINGLHDDLTIYLLKKIGYLILKLKPEENCTLYKKVKGVFGFRMNGKKFSDMKWEKIKKLKKYIVMRIKSAKL